MVSLSKNHSLTAEATASQFTCMCFSCFLFFGARCILKTAAETIFSGRSCRHIATSSCLRHRSSRRTDVLRLEWGVRRSKPCCGVLTSAARSLTCVPAVYKPCVSLETKPSIPRKHFAYEAQLKSQDDFYVMPKGCKHPKTQDIYPFVWGTLDPYREQWQWFKT